MFDRVEPASFQYIVKFNSIALHTSGFSKEYLTPSCTARLIAISGLCSLNRFIITSLSAMSLLINSNALSSFN